MKLGLICNLFVFISMLSLVLVCRIAPECTVAFVLVLKRCVRVNQLD